jgi:hypothetical protein
MTAYEFHVACLMKMGYGVSAIARATNKPKSSTFRKMNEIKQHLAGLLEDGRCPGLPPTDM